MKHFWRTVITVVLIGMTLLAQLPHAYATTPDTDVLITELQTSNTTASEEFIELYNTTSHDIDFGDAAHQGKDIWKLQFFSSTKVTAAGFNWDPKTSGLTTISLSRSDNSPVVIPAHSYFLISTTTNNLAYSPGGVDPDFTYSSGHMSDSGGGVQLVDVSGTGTTQVITAHDHLGWFQPTTGTALPAGFYLTPAATTSLQRVVTDLGSYVTSAAALEPFVTASSITPKETWAPPLDPAVNTNQTDESNSETPTDGSDSTASGNPGTGTGSVPSDTLTQTLLEALQITELLPNPAAPQTDANDEFVELFNPNSISAALRGYTVQTGLNYAYSYLLTDQTISASGYLLLTSGQTNLSLANAGGQARLLDPHGQVVSQTSAYDQAPIGEAWALADDGTWQWTTTPTPGAGNQIALPVEPPPKVATTKAAAKTTTKTTKPAANKAAPKVAKPVTTAKVASTTSSNQPAPLHTAVLVGVGLIAVLYALYEYRTDMGNKLYQLRRNRKVRRADRQTATGR